MKIPKYRKDKLNDNYDIIVIGSGISGLCSAALLSMEGKKVLVLEKHFKVGGYTHTFRRQNYEWDVGIHYIGGMHKKNSFSRKLFDKITDNNLKWNKTDDNYDRVIFPDKSYDFVAPKSKFIENLKNYFPEESSNIDTYIQTITSINKSMFKYFAAKGLSGFKEILFSNYLSKDFLKFSDKTTYQALSEITSNQRLIGVLTGQWGDYGLPPKQSSFAMHCAIAAHYLDGANYPVGGSRSISETIVPVIEKNGGQLFVSAGVESIYIKNGQCKGVILENGDIPDDNPFSDSNNKKSSKIISPGMLKKHYSPGIPVLLNQKKADKNCALITFGKKYKKKKTNYFNLSKKSDLKEAASNLYKTFRKIKKQGFKKIYVVKIPNIGAGIAINDRLKRASN